MARPRGAPCPVPTPISLRDSRTRLRLDRCNTVRLVPASGRRGNNQAGGRASRLGRRARDPPPRQRHRTQPDASPRTPTPPAQPRRGTTPPSPGTEQTPPPPGGNAYLEASDLPHPSPEGQEAEDERDARAEQANPPHERARDPLIDGSQVGREVEQRSGQGLRAPSMATGAHERQTDREQVALAVKSPRRRQTRVHRTARVGRAD